MATVTGFEGLRHPRRGDLRQFGELFEPLFLGSSDEARRQAAAALSQCVNVPQSVASAIGNAPISIAAIFLTRSASISDQTLLQIIRSQGPAHATAIARRDNLSVQVVDALVDRRQTASVSASPASRAVSSSASGQDTAARLLREEQLRNDIKALARVATQARTAGTTIEPASPLQEALLVRFARTGEANLFAASLADALGAGRDMGERMLLDISGQQVATALAALDLSRADSLFILGSFYPDLSERFGGSTRADVLMQSLTTETARQRVQSWIASEKAAASDAVAAHQTYLAEDRAADPRGERARPAPSLLMTGEPRQQQAFGRRR